MTTSCGFLKLCSLTVAFANLTLGLYILVEGIFRLQEFFRTDTIPIALVVVHFQLASFLIFVGVLLLIGTIKEHEKHISLYILLSSLIWFIISMLAISYMLFYNTTAMTQPNHNKDETLITTPAPTGPPPPKETVPMNKAVGFSIGLVLIWCGQLGVYKFHDQVIEKNVIDAGESYVSTAMSS